jgi:outer membrane protein assembly factor BamE (lipoprotein component of BamABCDE complex)
VHAKHVGTPSSEEAFMQNGWPYVLVNQMRGSWWPIPQP